MKNWPWYGYLLLAVIIFGLFYLVYYKPKNQELKDLREERIKLEDEVAQLRMKKKELDKIEAEIKRMDIVLQELEAIIPQKKEISDILRRMQQLAYDSRLNIVKFIPKGEISKEFYSEWPISIEITGNYHNLAMFFDRLSRFSRIFNVEDFSIKAIEKQSEATTISATWTAKTYIFHEESPSSEKTQTGKNK
ncbi:MAG: type 4a pilus biogenesis protein PilO [Candidatus Aminicenantales bacterium]